MSRGLGWLVSGFVGATFLSAIWPRQVTPPGNVLQAGHVFAIAVALAASWQAGRHGASTFAVALFGVLVAAPFWVSLWGPDGRDWIGIGMGAARLEYYLVRYVVFIVMMAAACTALRAVAARRRLPRRRYPVGRCDKCGYPLRGLPEPRCPECAEPFDPAEAAER